jgi:hypothetical protein
MMTTSRTAPWPDFQGQPIHEGDTIQHPVSGQSGRVLFLQDEEEPANAWRVDYGDGKLLSRLCLQIGEKGRAVVVAPDVPAQS